MSAKLFRVIVQVGDIEQAASFYATLLGMEGSRVSNGRHYFNCEGTILACLDPRADGDDFDATPSPDHIYLAVDDIEASYAAAQTAGAKLAEGDVHGDPAGEIAQRPWGEKSFYIEDPFGNHLCLVERSTMFTG